MREGRPASGAGDYAAVMWRRLRRRTLAPRRPLAWRPQAPVAVVSIALLLCSAAYAVWVVLSH
jgi:hypothetical protein